MRFDSSATSHVWVQLPGGAQQRAAAVSTGSTHYRTSSARGRLYGTSYTGELTNGSDTWTWDFSWDDYASGSYGASSQIRPNWVDTPGGNTIVPWFFSGGYDSSGVFDSPVVGKPYATQWCSDVSCGTEYKSVYSIYSPTTSSSYCASSGWNTLSLSGTGDPFHSAGSTVLIRPAFSIEYLDNTFSKQNYQGEFACSSVDDYGNSLVNDVTYYSEYFDTLGYGSGSIYYGTTSYSMT